MALDRRTVLTSAIGGAASALMFSGGRVGANETSFMRNVLPPTPRLCDSDQRFLSCDFYDFGLPVYQRNGKRIWALTEHATQISHSDDYGDHWTDWCTLPTNLLPNGLELHIDSRNNLYYGAGITLGTSAFVKVSSTDKRITKEFEFYHPSCAPPAEKASEGVIRAYTWSFTEDNSGYLYVGQYHLCTLTGGQYIWRFNPNNHWHQKNANKWERIDFFASEEPKFRHVHALHANPYTNKVYVGFGDFLNDGQGTYKRFYVSEDHFLTFKRIPDPSDRESVTGWTGLTFTPNEVIVSDDTPECFSGLRIGLWSFDPSHDDDAPKIIYEPDQRYRVPIYYVRAIRDNPGELWLTCVNDGEYRKELGCAVDYSNALIVIKKIRMASGRRRMCGLDHVIGSTTSRMTGRE